MKIKKILLILQEIAKRHNISEPFITGGTPRDKLLGKLESIEDLDVTTGDDTIHTLAKEFGRVLESIGAAYKVLGDGHAQVTIGPMKVDFSSNYRSPQIDLRLKKVGIKDPSEMDMELYSRDFTVNALLLSLDLKTIKDPTGMGVDDLERRVIRTILPVEVTLKDNTRRVVRVLYLAAKLGFDVHPEIIEWVRANPSIISDDVKPKYLSDTLQKAVDHDVEKTASLITQMRLWKYVPMLPALIPYLQKQPEAI